MDIWFPKKTINKALDLTDNTSFVKIVLLAVKHYLKHLEDGDIYE